METEIKTIDLDKLFDEYISDYVYKNVGKIKAEEIENNIPVLYGKFGDEKLAALGGKTPNTFYRDYPAESLIKCLKAHIDGKVPVSDFLCEAIIAAKDGERAVVKALNAEESEEFTAYLMNMLSDMKGKIPKERYMEFAFCDYPDSVGELATEFLCEIADEVRSAVIEQYESASDRAKERIAEILSRAGKDDGAFNVLLSEFIKHGENLPLYAGYLARYGDERALPYLTAAAENEKISYADYEELRFAIESLGGECKPRDFSADKTYKKIKGIKGIKKRNIR